MIIPQSIVATSLFREVKQAKAKSSRPWTKNKRDTSAKYLENTAYRRTTFSKKSKGIKKYANDFPQQTGAEIKIVIYNPDNKKTQTYYTKNVSVPFGRESKHSTVKKSPAAAAAPPPLVHSPFKGLNFANQLSQLSTVIFIRCSLVTHCIDSHRFITENHHQKTHQENKTHLQQQIFKRMYQNHHLLSRE